MKAETKFIRQIQKMASDVEFQSKHIRNSEKDFKRTRKLTFSDVIMYTIVACHAKRKKMTRKTQKPPLFYPILGQNKGGFLMLYNF